MKTPIVLVILFALCAACSSKTSQNKEIQNTPEDHQQAVVEANNRRYPCTVVSADRMNIFYIGVDNPVTISRNGDISNVKVSCSGGGCHLSVIGEGKYNVRVSTPGKANISVSAPGEQPEIFEFRVKRFPDPVVSIGRYKSSISAAEFKAQKGIRAELKNIDINARCAVVGFEVIHIPKGKEPVIATQPGENFIKATRNIIDAAKSDDIYCFNGIQVRCPGDAVERKVNDLVIKIK